jgi:hypothetical protein
MRSPIVQAVVKNEYPGVAAQAMMQLHLNLTGGPYTFPYTASVILYARIFTFRIKTIELPLT